MKTFSLKLFYFQDEIENSRDRNCDFKISRAKFRKTENFKSPISGETWKTRARNPENNKSSGLELFALRFLTQLFGILLNLQILILEIWNFWTSGFNRRVNLRKSLRVLSRGLFNTREKRRFVTMKLTLILRSIRS